MWLFGLIDLYARLRRTVFPGGSASGHPPIKHLTVHLCSRLSICAPLGASGFMLQHLCIPNPGTGIKVPFQPAGLKQSFNTRGEAPGYFGNSARSSHSQSDRFFHPTHPCYEQLACLAAILRTNVQRLTTRLPQWPTSGYPQLPAA